MMKVCVLGAGAWGTTIASLTTRNGMPTTLWARRSEVASEINWSHCNSLYLPDIELPKKLRGLDRIDKSVRDADVIVMAVPSHSFRAVLRQAAEHVRPWVPIVSLAKGLEPQTLIRMTEVIREVVPGHPAGALTGPNLAREIIEGHAAASVLAMENESVAAELQDIFSHGRFRVYTSRDVIGCELGGAFKNVVALACGMADGMGAGSNTRAGFITRGLAEISRLGIAMGGAMESFIGLAGVGDMIATCTSSLSRNHQVGMQIARGKTLRTILDAMHSVAEGVNTTKIMITLGERYGIEVPFARQVYAVLYENVSIAKAFRDYLNLTPGKETEPG